MHTYIYIYTYNKCCTLGRHYMLSKEGTETNQHTFVKNTLSGLMTPFLPPFYRIFMSGIVPSSENGDPEWLVI